MPQVNENGAFSFGQSWRFSHPEPFPTSYAPSRSRLVLSPFWSDVDIRKAGTVRYALVTRGTSTLGDMIMNNASTYVNSHFIGEDELVYDPTWVLVAQWDGVHPHPHGSRSQKGIDKSYLTRVS